MDPDKLLEGLRAARAAVLKLVAWIDAPGEGARGNVESLLADLGAHATALAEHTAALDEWLTKGGAPPAAWRPRNPAADAGPVTAEQRALFDGFRSPVRNLAVLSGYFRGRQAGTVVAVTKHGRGAGVEYELSPVALLCDRGFLAAFGAELADAYGRPLPPQPDPGQEAARAETLARYDHETATGRTR